MGIFDIFKKSVNAVNSANPLTDDKEAFQKRVDELNKISSEIKNNSWTNAVKLTLEKRSTELIESKVGGVPYLPQDMEIPTGADGSQMKLIAQINCSDVHGVPDFMDTGILQFYCSDNDNYGLDFDDQTNQANFRVLYHDTIDTTVTCDDVQKKIIADEDDESYFPVQDEYAVNFEQVRQCMTSLDFRYEKAIVEKYNELHADSPINEVYDIYDVYYEIERDENYGGHKIGGYPDFTQSDQRFRYPEYDFLLFQLDGGSGDSDIEWGDSGIANFFISTENLRKRDFSDVMYNWDCC